MKNRPVDSFRRIAPPSDEEAQSILDSIDEDQ
ncbi:Crp/Fnr family transcriptional regulator [Corallococcus coralloides]|uniref:Crp/Fnr family transcriptional regulator n=1 Tax=Corallococcus coralloides TaxID=184914 RepID=A0A410RR98_CORCK|nr:Crp/Fnr family transcriptional regulator [Corallococcus coralloides]